MATNDADARALQAAIREVMTPSRTKLLVGMLLHNAIERRDTRAAQLLLERVLGKVRNEPLPRVSLDLPTDLKTAADVKEAANALLKAVASGQIAPEDAQRMSALIETVRKSIETEELERRIRELEERQKRDERR